MGKPTGFMNTDASVGRTAGRNAWVTAEFHLPFAEKISSDRERVHGLRDPLLTCARLPVGN
jgi:hypothetical protein